MMQSLLTQLTRPFAPVRPPPPAAVQVAPPETELDNLEAGRLPHDGRALLEKRSAAIGNLVGGNPAAAAPPAGRPPLPPKPVEASPASNGRAHYLPYMFEGGQFGAVAGIVATCLFSLEESPVVYAAALVGTGAGFALAYRALERDRLQQGHRAMP